MADIGHLVRHDQVVLGVDGGLHVVADDTRCLCRWSPIKRASGSVNETCWLEAPATWRSIPLRNCISLRRPAILLFGMVCLGFAEVAFLAIRPVERAEVAGDAGVDLLPCVF
jgi:hypothetical protein